MTGKKIAFVLAGSYQTSLYLVTRYVVQQLREEQGWQVDFVFVDEPESGLKDNDKAVTITGLSHKSLYSPSGFLFRILKNILGKNVYQYCLSRYFSRQLDEVLSDYDMAFIHGTVFIPFCALRMPHYGVLHSCKYVNFLGRHRGWVKRAYQWMYQRIYSGHHLLTVSDDAKKDLINCMGAVPLSIETIYNGFDFSALEQRANQGIIERVPEQFIMAAGRPDRTKRFDLLIQAYAKTKRTHKLVIFGEGRKLPELKRLSQELGVENDVLFWGFCDNLLPYYKRASAYILSSDIEGLPTVVIESIALGTPVVATDAGGVNELLSGRLRHWVVPRGNVECLAKKIDEILAVPPSVSSKDLAFLDYRAVASHYAMLSERLSD